VGATDQLTFNKYSSIVRCISDMQPEQKINKKRAICFRE